MLSAFALKIIAVITMAIDHTGYLIFGKLSFMNYIGRIAFPIFAFQITEGYTHTHNLKKYFLRLFAFALISQIPFMLFHSLISKTFALNVFFTLFLGLASILIYDKLSNIDCKKKYIHRLYQLIGIAITGLIAYLASLIHTDYGYFGVLAIFVFYIFKNNRLLMNIGFTILVLIYNWFSILRIYIIQYNIIPDSIITYFSLHTTCTLLPLVFINLYNHKKGKDTKYFLYLFYPIHLLIIYLLHLVFVA